MATIPSPATIAQARAEYPTLTPVEPHRYATADLALVNVRRDLKEHFPTTVFRTRLQTRRGGATVLTLTWTEWEGITPSSDEVDMYVRDRWVHRTNLDQSFEVRQRRECFFNVFGSVERLQLEPVPPTPEQRVRYERKALNDVMSTNAPSARSLQEASKTSPRSRRL